MSLANGSLVYPIIVFWLFMLMTRETQLKSNEQNDDNNNSGNSDDNLSHNQIKCGEYLNTTNGIIQTPGFPKRFPVPIRCRWIIDASAHTEKNIVVYLTQLYVTTGLKFTDYVYYEKESGLKYSESSGHIVTPENVTTSPWIRSFTPYLVIEFELDRLEGNHLRFLDDKHNVYFMYGFNVTFELVDRDVGVRESCNARICSLLGECYANANYTKYECSCFQGFSGPNCAQGPLCEGHTCNNGGTCV